MPKFVATFTTTSKAVQQTMKELPSQADLGNGIRQLFSENGKMCCVFEAANETVIENFLKDKKPADFYRVDFEWDRATGKFLNR